MRGLDKKTRRLLAKALASEVLLDYSHQFRLGVQVRRYGSYSRFCGLLACVRVSVVLDIWDDYWRSMYFENSRVKKTAWFVHKLESLDWSGDNAK